MAAPAPTATPAAPAGTEDSSGVLMALLASVGLTEEDSETAAPVSAGPSQCQWSP